MRITLDTNQLVRALMRPPQLATFIMAWESRRFTVVGAQPLIAEYLAVLADAEIAPLVNRELLLAFTSHLLRDIELIHLPDIPQVCRDASDDKVIATAVYGSVDYLVTADDDLKTPSVVQLLADTGIAVVESNALIRLLDRGYRA